MPYIIPVEMKRLAVALYSSNRHMDVGVFGVVVRYCNPFEIRSQIGRDPFGQVASEPLQIDTLPELGRQDDFPYPLVTRRLPPFELADNVDRLSIAVERYGAVAALACAFSGKIPPVGLPLPTSAVVQVGYADCATLTAAAVRIGPVRYGRPAPDLSAVARIVHQQSKPARPSYGFALRRTRLSRPNPDWAIVIAQDHGLPILP
jgi:hypothetical protein